MLMHASSVSASPYSLPRQIDDNDRWETMQCYLASSEPGYQTTRAEDRVARYVDGGDADADADKVDGMTPGCWICPLHLFE